MAADDLVIYNGVSMRRDYAESLESAQRLAFYRVSGRDIARLRFGDETNPMVTPGQGLCQCCLAARGQFHEPLCEREQCPVCRQQVMSCDCPILTDDAVDEE
jgi:hypothetical protein